MADNNYLFEQMKHFEAWLKQEADESRVDYASIEKKLFSRISEAEENKELLLLKLQETPPDAFWKKVENNLFRNITEYEEYQQPVDQCISSEENPESEAIMKRAETRLSSKIDEASRMPEWECGLKAEVFPTQGKWENIEEKLFERIDESKNNNTGPTKFLSFPGRVFYKIAAVVILSLLTGIGGFLGYQTFFNRTPTYIYQAHGSDMEKAGGVFYQKTECASSPRGSVKFANIHGYALLKNGASAALKRMSQNRAEYSLDFHKDAGTDEYKGSASFFAAANSDRKSFRVLTDEYTIEVTGTYFRITPDINDKITARVLEGRINVMFENKHQVHVHEGERLIYDESEKKYVIEKGEPVVSRSEIDNMPDLEKLPNSCALIIKSNISFADIFIDGLYRGTAPLKVLLSKNRHVISAGSAGHAPFDTTIDLNNSSRNTVYISLEKEEKGTAPVYSKKPRSIPLIRAPEISGDSLIDSASYLFEKARAAESRDWKKAVEYYNNLLSMKNVSSLKRQTALFSVGKLYAEHSRRTEKAKEIFLRYITLYEHGLFTRESLLRLAEIEFRTSPAKAVDYYKIYFKKYPNHYGISDLQYRVGLIYFQQKEYEEAISMFKQSLSNMIGADPEKRKKIYEKIYRASMENGDVEKAMSIKENYLSTE